MKKGLFGFIGILCLFCGSLSAAVPDWGNINTQPPKDCRKAGYTCVLKVVDGEAFWCQKTSRDRFHKARQTFRVTKRIRCIRRFAVERLDPPKQEEE